MGKCEGHIWIEGMGGTYCYHCEELAQDVVEKAEAKVADLERLIFSNSVQTALRAGYKNPSNIGLNDGEYGELIELYNTKRNSLTPPPPI